MALTREVVATVSQAVGAGSLLGLAAGAAARLAMRALFLMNPDREGVIVGEIFPVGRVTAQGTGLILFQGIILGAVAGGVYWLVRPALPRPWFPAGMIFGVWLVASFLGLLVVGEDRDFRLFGPFVAAVGLFGVIFVLHGAALAYVVDRTSPAPKWRSVSTWRRAITRVLLGLSATPGTVILALEAARRA